MPKLQLAEEVSTEFFIKVQITLFLKNVLRLIMIQGVSKLRSIISCLQMDPKALEALPTEKATKMELKRGQVGFHWSATKFQQRYRIQLNSNYNLGKAKSMQIVSKTECHGAGYRIQLWTPKAC